MSMSVIANNTSIKIDQFIINFSQSSTLGLDFYTAASNEYIDINFASGTHTFTRIQIKYINGVLFDVLPLGASTFTTLGTPNKVILPPGCKLNVYNGSAQPSLITILGTRFINSP